VLNGAGTTIFLDTKTAIGLTLNTIPSNVDGVPDATGQIVIASDVHQTSASGFRAQPFVVTTIAKVAATATYYVTVGGDFTTSTANVYGTITATRVR
jgi:hypothetical protein